MYGKSLIIIIIYLKEIKLILLFIYVCGLISRKFCKSNLVDLKQLLIFSNIM